MCQKIGLFTTLIKSPAKFDIGGMILYDGIRVVPRKINHRVRVRQRGLAEGIMDGRAAIRIVVPEKTVLKFHPGLPVRILRH